MADATKTRWTASATANDHAVAPKRPTTAGAPVGSARAARGRAQQQRNHEAFIVPIAGPGCRPVRILLGAEVINRHPLLQLNAAKRCWRDRQQTAAAPLNSH